MRGESRYMMGDTIRRKKDFLFSPSVVTIFTFSARGGRSIIAALYGRRYRIISHQADNTIRAAAIHHLASVIHSRRLPSPITARARITNAPRSKQARPSADAPYISEMRVGYYMPYGKRFSYFRHYYSRARAIGFHDASARRADGSPHHNATAADNTTRDAMPLSAR